MRLQRHEPPIKYSMFSHFPFGHFPGYAASCSATVMPLCIPMDNNEDGLPGDNLVPPTHASSRLSIKQPVVEILNLQESNLEKFPNRANQRFRRLPRVLDLRVGLTRGVLLFLKAFHPEHDRSAQTGRTRLTESSMSENIDGGESCNWAYILSATLAQD